MAIKTTVTAQDLDLEHAELLPSRETLSVGFYRPGCGCDGDWGHGGDWGRGGDWGHGWGHGGDWGRGDFGWGSESYGHGWYDEDGLVRLSVLNCA